MTPNLATEEGLNAHNIRNKYNIQLACYRHDRSLGAVDRKLRGQRRPRAIPAKLRLAHVSQRIGRWLRLL